MPILVNVHCDIPRCPETASAQILPQRSWSQLMEELIKVGWLIEADLGKVIKAICPYCEDPETHS